MACRANYAESEGGAPPCDLTRICGITKLPIDDENALMEIDEDTRLIVNWWYDIVLISERQMDQRVINKADKQQVITRYLPTLEKIDFYFNIKDWSIVKFDRTEMFYLISLFHREFIGVLFNG